MVHTSVKETKLTYNDYDNEKLSVPKISQKRPFSRINQELVVEISLGQHIW